MFGIPRVEKPLGSSYKFQYMDRIELLKRVSKLLPHVPAQELGKLLDISSYLSFPAKSVILESGNVRRKAFFILKGAVRGYVLNRDGQEKNILLRSEGIFVGDPSNLFAGQPQRMSMETIANAEVLVFSYDDFENLAFSSPAIMKVYLGALKEAVLRLSYRIDSMITMTGEERYLDLLDKNPAFLIDAYDKQVANFLGMTPVSFSRIKKKAKRSDT